MSLEIFPEFNYDEIGVDEPVSDPDEDSKPESTGPEKNRRHDQIENLKMSQAQNNLNNWYDVFHGIYSESSFTKTLGKLDNNCNLSLDVSCNDNQTEGRNLDIKIIKTGENGEVLDSASFNFCNFYNQENLSQNGGNTPQTGSNLVTNWQFSSIPNMSNELFSDILAIKQGNNQIPKPVSFEDVVKFLNDNIMKSEVNQVYGYMQYSQERKAFDEQLTTDLDLKNKTCSESAFLKIIEQIEEKGIKIDNIESKKSSIGIILLACKILRTSSQAEKDSYNYLVEDEKSFSSRFPTPSGDESMVEYLSSNFDFFWEEYFTLVQIAKTISCDEELESNRPD